MNPELTFTLPVYQVACGVVDIMMHTLDRYFCPILGNELSDQIAESVLRVAIEKGRAAVRDPHDYDAMSELMWAGSLSHNDLTGLGGVKDFAPHQLGHELSAMFDVAHGASLSTVWGSWADYCWETNPARFARYAKNVWGIENADERAAARAGIDATVDYFRSLGMPTCFGELGHRDAAGRSAAPTRGQLHVRAGPARWAPSGCSTRPTPTRSTAAPIIKRFRGQRGFLKSAPLPLARSGRNAPRAFFLFSCKRKK